ncbi:unnamed protein product [Orchesella dallaii]|uniref:J domain-containing protein n=1 Tax=Orchesella dallaii TaxID=48710 RepID=A0ABP1Q3N8_9HEXA
MGQKFQYDESGNTFLYFVMAFLALILMPCSYYFWPNPDKPKEKRSGVQCNCDACIIKEDVLKRKEPRKKLKRLAIRIALSLGWILFAFVAYKITQTDYEYANFDPYEILGVPLSASTVEIKKAYRKLSLLYHPDKETGDEKLFMKLTKAYQALTDDTARRNWEKYGNPDGPGAMSFGIALPSWIVDKENSVWVLGLYALVFMIALPTTVGIWWYRSIQYSSDKVLLDTTQLYYYFFHKTPQMQLKRALMVLAASMEFEKGHNSQVQERVSDNLEVPALIKQLPNLNEKNKERPLCFHYSVKARALLHAHLSRLPLPPNTLELDRQLVIRKSPYLIQEMVTCVSQLIMLAHAGRIGRLPTLDTIESVMKMSPMIVQALWETKSPMMQLPHITEDMQKYFMSKKRNISTVQQFCQMKDEDRRNILKGLSDDQYADVMKVCASMPLIDFKVQCEVLDDEESANVTAGAIVTVTVTLTRNSMNSLLKGENALMKSSHALTTANDDQDEDKENREVDADGNPLQVQNKKPVWQKKKGGAKKPGGKGKHPPPKKNAPVPAIKPAKSAESAEKTKEMKALPDMDDSEDDGASEGSPGSDSDSGSENPDKQMATSGNEDDDDEWEKCQSRLAKNKERALEGKSKISHPVHCPYFPEVKQEYWWTYVSDRKNKQLVTAPYLVTNLVRVEECQLQFTAPRKPGHYKFTVCLRSDSFLGFDQLREIKLDVQEAKRIEEHPQWELLDEEEEKEVESEESEYATDDDVDDDDEDDDDDD